MNIQQAIGQKMMLHFEGAELTDELLDTISQQHLGGFTFFRGMGNTESPAQVRALTAALQATAKASGQPPLLFGTDQEGGQLMAIGNGTTEFPGNLALGATGSAELSQKVGHALGLELAAMGVNINYAPACDVNSNPQNPVIGTRSFGEDPELVGRLTAAMIKGLQSAGIAATAKHFPGHGDTANDSHHGVPIIPHNEDRLNQIELPPFKAAIEAGVRLMMNGHVALPALQNSQHLPATLSPQVVHLLRDNLGFEGVTITDCMDMGAIEQGLGLIIDTIAAARAGMDLLLFKAEPEIQWQIYKSLNQAAQRGLLSQKEAMASAKRILALKQWLAQSPQPDLAVVGCTEHQALAKDVAQQSITLVRDQANLLPLHLPTEAKIAVVIPESVDLTPADTSSYIKCTLPDEIRRRHRYVTEFMVSQQPTDNDISALRAQVQNFDLIIVGTINANVQTKQAAMVNALLKIDTPLIAIALRMPYDLQAYPTAPTYLCTYSLLAPSMEALAQVVWGEISPQGQLPVSIPDLYPLRHSQMELEDAVYL